ncbi:rhodanese-like domain-containing protein [Roseimaritima sediminicola]|uniref:rhodanese-like domain-containing protein n=1 Tax=Roseimaritima sediminicola TaxID=2662066 RepID=UPI00192A18B8|nr:rhodanese-like domain-containing protein [Roseimaritima sediminicola]
MRVCFLLLLMAVSIGCSDRDTAVSTAEPSAPASDATAQDVSATETDDSATEASTMPGEAALVIDVRSQNEWDDGHVAQAVHIPHTEIADQIDQHTTDKDRKIVVYCAAGVRAQRAKESLEDLGFTDVENAGGLDDVRQRYEMTE